MMRLSYIGIPYETRTFIQIRTRQKDYPLFKEGKQELNLIGMELVENNVKFQSI